MVWFSKQRGKENTRSLVEPAGCREIKLGKVNKAGSSPNKYYKRFMKEWKVVSTQRQREQSSWRAPTCGWEDIAYLPRRVGE